MRVWIFVFHGIYPHCTCLHFYWFSLQFYVFPSAVGQLLFVTFVVLVLLAIAFNIHTLALWRKTKVLLLLLLLPAAAAVVLAHSCRIKFFILQQKCSYYCWCCLYCFCLLLYIRALFLCALDVLFQNFFLTCWFHLPASPSCWLFSLQHLASARRTHILLDIL